MADTSNRDFAKDNETLQPDDYAAPANDLATTADDDHPRTPDGRYIWQTAIGEFVGTQNRPSCWKYSFEHDESNSVHKICSGQLLLPTSIPKPNSYLQNTVYIPKPVGYLFDGQYVYECDPELAEREELWTPIARSPQTWDPRLHGEERQWLGAFMFIPRRDGNIWHCNTTTSKADPEAIQLLRTHDCASGANFSSAQLQGANLSSKRLNNVLLKGAVLNDAILYGTSLRGAKLQWAKMARCDLRWALLQEATLYRALLIGAQMRMTNLEGTDLREADLNGADLRQATVGPVHHILDDNQGIREISSRRTRFDGASFKHSRLQGVDFSNTDLRSMKYLADAAIIECNMIGCQLTPDQFNSRLFTERIAISFARPAHALSFMLREEDSPAWMRYDSSLWSTFIRLKETTSLRFGRGPKTRAGYFRGNDDLVCTARQWLVWARDSYLRIKKCYLDQGAYTAASEIAMREKLMEYELRSLDSVCAVADSWEHGAEFFTGRTRDGEQCKRAQAFRKFIKAVGTWLLMRWKLNGHHFYYRVTGYGEKPHWIIGGVVAVILLFALVFFFIGAPVTEKAPIQQQAMSIANETQSQYLTAWNERKFGVMSIASEGWGESLWQPVLLSMECFSTLGFFWLSQREYTLQNSMAVFECLLGVYFAALFIWCVGRRLSAR